MLFKTTRNRSLFKSTQADLPCSSFRSTTAFIVVHFIYLLSTSLYYNQVNHAHDFFHTASKSD